MLGVSAIKRFGATQVRKSPGLRNFARFQRNLTPSSRTTAVGASHKSLYKPLPNQIVLVRPFFSSRRQNNQEDGGSKRLGMLASAGLGLSVLAGKAKYVLVALKLTKAAPAISMVLSSLAYSAVFGWTYGVGMVGLIFIHECGHAIVLHRYGVPFSPMVFIPFVGAVIMPNARMRNAYEEAMIAFGGPAMGSAAALGVGMLGASTGSQELLALADFGYMVNLFNLMPIGSLDGGRITGAVSPYFGVLGLAAGGAMIYEGLVHNPLFYLIMLSGTYTTASRIFGWSDEEQHNRNYYNIPGAQQGQILTGYVALIAAIIYAMRENDKLRKTPKQLQREKETGYTLSSPWDEGRKQGDGVYDDFFK